ncbi:MAG TPA: hypothetical protein VHC71_08175 [Hyphomicrobium sp.]|jgi:hypothetical protein|nr:hypothetical protein [Hyphomicrobium sp.]
MPPVMFLALIGAAGIAGYRIFSSLREGSKSPAQKRANAMRRAAAPARDLGSLEWDEAAGVYRPSPKRER